MPFHLKGEHMRYLVSLLLPLTLLAAVPESRGGDLSSPKGFKLTYPEGWQPVADEQLGKIAKDAGAAGIPMPACSAMILGPAGDGVPDNVSILVLPQTLAINPTIEKSLIDSVKMGAGGKVTDAKTQRRQVGGTTALAVAVEAEQPGGSMRVWQIFVPGKRQLYVVTCMAPKSHWAKAWPSFKQMIDSLQIDVPTAQ